jgi:ribose 5-phosphate isomerase B
VKGDYKMKIAIGCDNLGVGLKNLIVETFSKKGVVFEDFGTYGSEPIDYPDVAVKVAKKVKEDNAGFDRGILICGTGIGMAIAANKVSNVFAAVCHDIYSAERSILSNNIDILCMGALVIGPQTAVKIVEKWLELKFVDSPSTIKINKIKEIEASERAI